MFLFMDFYHVLRIQAIELFLKNDLSWILIPIAQVAQFVSGFNLNLS